MDENKKSIKRTLSRLDTRADKDIDYSDILPLSPKMLAKAIVRKGLKPVSHKSQIALRLDIEVLEMVQDTEQGLSNAYQRYTQGLQRSSG